MGEDIARLGLGLDTSALAAGAETTVKKFSDIKAAATDAVAANNSLQTSVVELARGMAASSEAASTMATAVQQVATAASQARSSASSGPIPGLVTEAEMKAAEEAWDEMTDHIGAGFKRISADVQQATADWEAGKIGIEDYTTALEVAKIGRAHV